MKLEKIKEEMIAYRDFFGGDLINVSEVDNAQTKEELKQIIWRHHSHMEDMLSDAKSHLNHFQNKLGI